jgi:ribonucleotide reductase alpha subunit
MMLRSNIEPTFKLSEKFLEQYEGKQPDWGFGNLSYFTYKRTYARIMENGLQEEFVDTCIRVVEGTYQAQERHCKSNGIPWKPQKAQASAQEMFRRMWDFKWLPPGRGLWMMGTHHVEKVGSAALNNCGFVSTEDIGTELGAPFSWSMDMLMLGVGIGFDTKGANRITVHSPQRGPTVYTIPDTREGWVESVRLLLNSYGHHNSSYVKFQYDQIRPAGMPIRGFGGVSSGPKPLIECHEAIRTVLDELDGEKLTSVAIVDIMNLIGKCVVAGNVRRSAELAIGEIDDKDYVEMKDYTKFPTELADRRWASNNSVFADRFTDFSLVSDNILTNGEPGLIFLDNARHYGRLKDGWLPETDRRYDYVMGFNPCAEQQLESYELCCLVETFPANHDTAEDYMRTLKFAYLYAKSVTLIPTHDERTNSVIMRNRRIGTSMSGIQQAVEKFGRQPFLDQFCDKGYSVIKEWDRLYSRWFGVPESHRVTTVKPSGTVSLLAGATPGVHFTHSKAYWRTVRLAANSHLLPKLQDAGFKLEYAMTDWEKVARIRGKSYKGKKQKQELMKETKEFIETLKPGGELLKKFAEENGTVVVYFPVIEKNYKKSKFDVTIWEQLQTVREMQYWWADNSVSCTITVKPDEKSDLLPAIEFAAPYVKTLSFLPLDEHGYEQAVYQEADEEDVLEYMEGLGELDLSDEKQKQILGSRFCDGDKCEI